MADYIVALLERHPELREELSELKHEDWLEYQELSYRETKIRDGLVSDTCSTSSLKGGVRTLNETMEGNARDAPEIQSVAMSSFNALFSSGTDEQLARYFCQQVIASLPNRFIFTDEGDNDDQEEEDEEGREGDEGTDDDGHHRFGYDEGDEDDNLGGRPLPWDVDSVYAPSIEIPVEPNGVDSLLEMEMRFSTLAGDLSNESHSGSEDDSPTIIDLAINNKGGSSRA